MLPTLSRLSVGSGPAGRLRHRCSSRSLRIPPLHREFHRPLPVPRRAVSGAVHGVEPRDFTPDLPHPPARALRPVIPNNARALRLTAAVGTELAGASSGGTVSPAQYSHAGGSSPLTAVYTPKGFLPHAASLRQPLGHCAKFPTAASRRSLGRVSVPMWGAILSDPLPVVALVSRHLTN